MLEYCWQCGTHLNGGGQFYQGAQPTREYNVPNPAQIYQGYGQNYQPNFQPRKSTFSAGRVALVLGGIFFFFMLIAGAGAAVVYRIANTPPRYYPENRYRQPAPVKSPAVRENPVSDKRKSGKASAELEKIWVDYDVRENGRLGMRIHVRFSVFNMKGVDSQLVVSFEKADGTQLTTTDKKFANKDGQVAVSRALKPGWDDTVYKDLDVFMPYEELKLGPGRYDLKMDADVTHQNGDLVEHLGYHDFEYEKK